MARRGSGGAQLASGYISLSVKYASAMSQVAKDFNFVERSSESAGRAISRNLATGVEQAKAQVKTLASQYAQAKVASDAAAASLEKLSKAHSVAAGATEQAGKATATSAAKLELEAAAQDVAAAAKQKAVELYGQYSSAIDDARRKQDLLSASLASSNKSVQSASAGAQRIGNAFQTHIAQAGTKSARMFHQRFAAQMVRSGQGAMQTGKNFASSMLMGMTPMTLGAAGIGLAVGAAFKSGFDRNADINTAKIRLEALGYDVATVNQITADATKSVTDTQYSLADAMTASTQAMAMGIKPGKEMTEYLTMISNAAALSGRSFGEISEVMGRVHRYGTIRLENLESMISAQVPAMEVLKEYYKTDEAGIRKMVQNHEISAAQLEGLLSKRLEGMATEIGRKGVVGAFRNLWVQVGKVTASILEPIFGDIPAFLTKTGDAIGNFANYIKPGMYAFTERMKKLWSDVQPYLVEGWEWFQNTWNELWPNVKEVFGVFAEHWQEMWPKLQEKLGPFFQSLKRMWDSVFPLLKLAGQLVGWVALKFIDSLPSIVQFATDIIDLFSDIRYFLSDKFWPWFRESWEDFTDDIVGAWNSAVEFKDKVVDAFEKIKSGTTAVWDWLKEKFDWFTEKIDFFRRNAHWITDPFGSVVDAFQGGSKYSGEDVDLAAYSTAMPAGLKDTEGAVSGPQSRMAAAAIFSRFPQVETIGGARKSSTAKNTHDIGRSIDIPIPADDMALGDQIEGYLQANAKKFGIKYTIWRDQGKYPDGAGGRPGFTAGGHQNHIDVHFDGNPVQASSSVFTSTGGGGDLSNMLVSSLRTAGFSPDLTRAIQAMNQVESGGKAEGFLGFTQGQAPTPQAAISKFINEQWIPRTKGGVPGVTPDGQVFDWDALMTFIRVKIVGQQGVIDWQGNRQPPAQEYQRRLMNAVQQFATGGAIRDGAGRLIGPGSGTSDSIVGVNNSGIPIVRVSNGEGVVTKAAMDAGGDRIVEALNSGWLKRFDAGGTLEDFGFMPFEEFQPQPIELPIPRVVGIDSPMVGGRGRHREFDEDGGAPGWVGGVGRFARGGVIGGMLSRLPRRAPGGTIDGDGVIQQPGYSPLTASELGVRTSKDPVSVDITRVGGVSANKHDFGPPKSIVFDPSKLAPWLNPRASGASKTPLPVRVVGPEHYTPWFSDAGGGSKPPGVGGNVFAGYAPRQTVLDATKYFPVGGIPGGATLPDKSYRDPQHTAVNATKYGPFLYDRRGGRTPVSSPLGTGLPGRPSYNVTPETWTTAMGLEQPKGGWGAPPKPKTASPRPSMLGKFSDPWGGTNASGKPDIPGVKTSPSSLILGIAGPTSLNASGSPYPGLIRPGSTTPSTKPATPPRPGFMEWLGKIDTSDNGPFNPTNWGKPGHPTLRPDSATTGGSGTTGSGLGSSASRRGLSGEGGGGEGGGSPLVDQNDRPVGTESNPIIVDTPDAGRGGTPHGGGGTVGPDGVTRDANGNRIPKLAQGVGDIGQTAFGDMFEGTPFSNPLEWGATKSAGALLTFFGGLLSGNAGGGAGSLASMFFPDAGASGDTTKEGRRRRDAEKALKDKRHSVDKQQSDYDALLRNREATEEERADALYELNRAKEDLADDTADFNADFATPAASGGGGLGGLLSFIPSPSALLNPVQPAPGSSSGTGPLPGPQPPSHIPNVANTVPPIGSGGAGGPTSIDRSITVNGVTPEGTTATRDHLGRLENANLGADRLAISRIPQTT